MGGGGGGFVGVDGGFGFGFGSGGVVNSGFGGCSGMGVWWWKWWFEFGGGEQGLMWRYQVLPCHCKISIN